MDRIASLCALLCAIGLPGCKKNDVAPSSSSAPSAIVVTTSMAARSAPSPAADPSLPEASSVFPAPASSASAP